MRAAITHVTAGPFGLPWLPHVAAALSTGLAFGARGCVTGLLIASLAMFVVYLPVTALSLSGGQPVPADGPAPALTQRAHIALFGLWAATAWLAAALAG